MIRKCVYFFFLPLIISGCVDLHRDIAAEKAAESYRKISEISLKKTVPENLSDIIKQFPGKRYEIRKLFARFQTARILEDHAVAEICRIKLNALLGHLPDKNIVYITDGALDCPQEIPPVKTVEKAALIIDGGKTPAVELLAKIRILHAQTIRAMQKNSTPQEKLEYFLCTLALAEAIGIDLKELYDLSAYEKRFNAAQKRWEKSKNPEKSIYFQ